MAAYSIHRIPPFVSLVVQLEDKLHSACDNIPNFPGNSYKKTSMANI